VITLPFSLRATRGFTLVELLVGTLIASLLIASALRLLIHARITWQTSQNIAALEERAAYALAALEQDVRLAGYWGKHGDGSALTIQTGVTARCGGVDVTAWALDVGLAVQASNNTFTLPCTPYSGHVSGTDTLTVRHVGQVSVAPDAGRIQLYTDHTRGVISQSGHLPATAPTPAEIYNVDVHAWHLVQESSEPGLPALRRFALTDGGTLQNQEIIPGIENFQVTLGIDRDANGLVDGFVNPDAAAGNTVMAVRIWILLRSARPEPRHIDDGPWYSIDTNEISALRPGDGFRRIAAERTIWLRNLADT
jgi:type IV pilus assembly protein PilW